MSLILCAANKNEQRNKENKILTRYIGVIREKEWADSGKHALKSAGLWH